LSAAATTANSARLTRRVGRSDAVFKADLPIREVQIIQEALDQIHVLCVPADTWRDHHQDLLARRLQDRLGLVNVNIEKSTRLLAGKMENPAHRYLNCKINDRISRFPA
jgi:hypothetical protein